METKSTYTDQEVVASALVVVAATSVAVRVVPRHRILCSNDIRCRFALKFDTSWCHSNTQDVDFCRVSISSAIFVTETQVGMSSRGHHMTIYLRDSGHFHVLRGFAEDVLIGNCKSLRKCPREIMVAYA